MTREEAIKILEEYLPKVRWNTCDNALTDAMELAIEALSQPERPKGRWIRIPEELNCDKLLDILAELYCPRYVGLNDWQGTESCDMRDCTPCWKAALRGEEE